MASSNLGGAPSTVSSMLTTRYGLNADGTSRTSLDFSSNVRGALPDRFKQSAEEKVAPNPELKKSIADKIQQLKNAIENPESTSKTTDGTKKKKREEKKEQKKIDDQLDSIEKNTVLADNLRREIKFASMTNLEKQDLYSSLGGVFDGLDGIITLKLSSADKDLKKWEKKAKRDGRANAYERRIDAAQERVDALKERNTHLQSSKTKMFTENLLRITRSDI